MCRQDNRKHPTLVDGELRLRPACLPADVSIAADWYRDPEVMCFSEGDENLVYDTAMIEQMYGCLAGLGELYIIELLQGETWVPIGDVTLAKETIPIVIGRADCRSRGYGRRVLGLLIDRARSLGWQQLKTRRVYVYNQRARRLFEGLGFRQVGGEFEDEGQLCVRFELQLHAD